MFQKNKSIKSKYHLETKLSEDMFSFSFQGKSETGDILAWQIKPEFLNPNLVKECIDLSEKLMAIEHPNVLKMLDYFYDGKTFFLIFDLANDYMTLDVFFKEHSDIEYKVLWKIVVQLLSAGVELENKGLMNGGLNFNNVFIDDNYQIKLTKIQLPLVFLQAITEPLEVYEDCIFFPPEFLQNGTYTLQSDIYAFGMFLYHLFSRDWPYTYSSSIRTLSESLIAPPKPIDAAQLNLPKKMESLIMRCIQKNPSQRFASFSELIKAYKQESSQDVKSALGRSNPSPSQTPSTSISNQQQGVVQAKDQNMSAPDEKSIEQELKENLAIQRLSKENSILRTLVGVLVLVLMLGSLYMAYQLYAVAIPIRRVPNTRGMALDDAMALLTSHKLAGEVVSTRTSAWYPQGFVLDQAPAYGRKVKENRVIKLYVSNGVKQVLIPDIIGKTLDDVQSVVSLQDIEIRVVGQKFSQSYPVGAILQQTPTPNNFINHNEPVKVVVSQGYPVGLKVSEVPSNIFFNYDGWGQCRISYSILPDWKPKEVTIYYIDETNKKDKLYSDMHFPNDKNILEFRLKIGGRIEVYFDDDLAMSREVKLTPKPVIEVVPNPVIDGVPNADISNVGIEANGNIGAQSEGTSLNMLAPFSTDASEPLPTQNRTPLF